MNKHLTCKYNQCNKYLLDPVLLNCSNNVCQLHINELINLKSEEFKCFVCSEEHKIPKEGYFLNKALTDILMLKFHLSDKEKQAADLIDMLNLNTKSFSKVVNDPDNFIYDYFAETRNKIDLERERLIKEINTISNEMLDKLSQFEDECEQNLNRLGDLNKQQKEYLAKFTKDILNWNEVMRQPSIDEKEIDKLIDDANKGIKEIAEKIFDYKNTLLLKKVTSFHATNTKIDHKLFGKFFVGNRLLSKILSTNQSIDLIKLCEFDFQTKFNLVYQASTHGFSADDFHSKCDNISNTLAIIKVKGNSNVFGGFSSVYWDRSNTYKFDPNAFIFSLINMENFPLKINVTNTSNAVFCSKNDFGVRFGYHDKSNYHDIYISNNSNANAQSCSNLGHSYISNSYSFQNQKSFLAGSQNFTTEEIEIFQVIKE